MSKMFLRSILFLCLGLLLNGCIHGEGVVIGGLAGPVMCAKKVIEDKDAGVLDYLKIPAVILFGPFIGFSRELEGIYGSDKLMYKIKYMADVCENLNREEYFNALREQERSAEEENKKIPSVLESGGIREKK